MSERLDHPVAAYKRILQQVCDNRPSGMRQRLATALGTNRSFISQLANPAYAVPIPPQHLRVIWETCHFSAAEREAFIHAYDQAHPGRRAGAGSSGSVRRLSLDVPDFGTAERNAAFDRMLAEHVGRIVKLIETLRDDA